MSSLQQPAIRGPIVQFGNVPLDYLWQRAQQLGCCLAESVDVVYVDPNRSFLQRLRSPLQLSPRLLPPRMHRFRPPHGWPLARRVPCLHAWNQTQTLSGLKRFLDKRELGEPALLLLTYPDQLDAIKAFPGATVVYDLMDEPTLFSSPGDARQVQRLHEALLQQAALTVMSSRVLMRRYHGQAQRVVYIPNGVSADLLCELECSPACGSLSRFPGPRFGYVGMIGRWFDFAAVEALARAFSHGTVILVGPVEVPLPRLPANVVFTGPVPHQRLAGILRAFDVALIPFRRNPEIDAIDPVKAYEYVAAGLPVLAAWWEELAHGMLPLRLYRNPLEAVFLARSILSGQDFERNTRVTIAQEHTWSCRAAELLRAVAQMNLTQPSALRIPGLSVGCK